MRKATVAELLNVGHPLGRTCLSCYLFLFPVICHEQMIRTPWSLPTGQLVEIQRMCITVYFYFIDLMAKKLWTKTTVLRKITKIHIRQACSFSFSTKIKFSILGIIIY